MWRKNLTCKSTVLYLQTNIARPIDITKLLQEILQLRGEILRRILIVTSLGWKEVYGVEAVKTLWPLSGNTFSCPTGLCIYCGFKTSWSLAWFTSNWFSNQTLNMQNQTNVWVNYLSNSVTWDFLWDMNLWVLPNMTDIGFLSNIYFSIIGFHRFSWKNLSFATPSYASYDTQILFEN